MMYDAINMKTKQQQRNAKLSNGLKGLRNFAAVSLIGLVMGAGFVYGLDKEMDVQELEGQHIATKFNKA